MAAIKEDYCSYEVAKLLKEKGFNEQCRAAYTNYGKLFTTQIQQYVTNVICSKGTLWDCTAPTHQMATKWLREKNIIIVIQPEYFNAESKCSAWGVDIWGNDNYEKLQGDFPSYEETVEASIKYCLENLI